MYGQGSGTPTVLGAATTATVLPVTGMSSAVELALALAAGLAVWVVVYVAAAKFGKR
jgi:hypothetical protein